VSDSTRAATFTACPMAVYSIRRGDPRLRSGRFPTKAD
jgi:hypothetical protein